MKELEGDPQGNVLAQILTALGGFNARLIDINEHVQDSHRALRGYDAEPGLVAITEELRKQVEELSKNTGADHDAIASLIHRIEALEKYNIDYPPLAGASSAQGSGSVGRRGAGAHDHPALPRS